MKSSRPYVMRVRAEAAEATRQRILASARALLLTHSFEQMTIESIAQGADTTARTVLRIFGDKEELFAQALNSLEEFAQTPIVAGDLDALVGGTYEFYEKVGDTVIRWLPDKPRSAAMHARLEVGRRHLRSWVGRAFAAALNPLQDRARRELHDALIVAFDVYTWKLLRRDFGLSRAAAQARTKRLVMGLIGGDVNG